MHVLWVAPNIACLGFIHASISHHPFHLFRIWAW